MNEERKRILKMVEDGKLKTEEALVLLEALENPKTEQNPTKTSDPSVYVDYEAGAKYQDYKNDYKQHSFKEKFSGFFETAFKKIKDVDLDFNFGPHFEINHIFQHRDVYLTKLHLDISNGEIELKPWDEQEVRIECKAKVYRVNSQDEAKRKFIEHVEFGINGNGLRFVVEPKHIKLHSTFYIPRSHYENIQIRMFNGQIAVDDLSVKDLKANTANGNIHMNHITGEEVEVETANGHIKVLDSRARDLEAETLNGTITVKGAFDKTDLQSFSSRIACHLTEPTCHTVEIKTKTGNIELIVPNEMEVNGVVKSNIGGFTCELNQLEVYEEKKEVVQKEMRFVASRGQQSKVDVEAESRTGSITIKTHN